MPSWKLLVPTRYSSYEPNDIFLKHSLPSFTQSQPPQWTNSSSSVYPRWLSAPCMPSVPAPLRASAPTWPLNTPRRCPKTPNLPTRSSSRRNPSPQGVPSVWWSHPHLDWASRDSSSKPEWEISQLGSSPRVHPLSSTRSSTVWEALK